jgi:chromosome segregation ATPase
VGEIEVLRAETVLAKKRAQQLVDDNADLAAKLAETEARIEAMETGRERVESNNRRRIQSAVRDQEIAQETTQGRDKRWEEEKANLTARLVDAATRLARVATERARALEGLKQAIDAHELRDPEASRAWFGLPRADLIREKKALARELEGCLKRLDDMECDLVDRRRVLSALERKERW